MPSKSKSQEEVIKDFIEVHGDIYDYSKVQYESAHKNITIVCSIHGDFSISSSNHKSGQGCKKCAIIKRAVTRKSNVEKIKQLQLPYQNPVYIRGSGDTETVYVFKSINKEVNMNELEK